MKTKKPEYTPDQHTQDVFDRIKNHKPRLSNAEVAWIERAIDASREHYAAQLYGAFDVYETKSIRWARKRLKDLDWLCNQLIMHRREMMEKSAPKRNPILRMPTVTLPRQQAQKANFEKLYGGKKPDRRAVKNVNFAAELHMSQLRGESPRKEKK